MSGMDKIQSRMARVPSWTELPPMDRSKAFFDPMNAAYTPGWKCANNSIKLDNEFVPKISDALAMKTLIRQPVKVEVDMSKYPTMALIKDAKANRHAEPVLSAAICPVKFPSPEADLFKYPKSGKRGGDNPLYWTTATLIGLEPPKQHQLTERYFPKNCEFAKSFTDTKKFQTRHGLQTRATMSRVHSDLDLPY